MSKAIEQLQKLSSKNQVDIIVNLMEQSNKNEKIVKTALASHDPKKLATLLTKEVNTLKKTASSYDYNEGDEVSDIIYSIIKKVDKHLVEQKPELAIDVLKKLIAIDKKLFDHIDDSYGYLSTAYYSLYEVLDSSFSFSNESPEEIAKYIIETFLDDSYGNRSDLLRQLKLSLQGKKALALETLIKNYKTDSYKAKVILEKAADLANDVDKYINIIKSNGKMSVADICEISEHLIRVGRFQEAANWLLGIQDAHDYKAELKDALLVTAYDGMGKAEEAQKLRWKMFKRNCSVNKYKQYIKNIPESKKDKVLSEAIQIAQNSEHLYLGISFLNDIEEYNLLEELILVRYNEVNGTDYGTYRSLSTTLAKQGKYLSATLLRRKLAQGCVVKAQSKYYRYAASDYKLCNDYAQKVQDWKEFHDHVSFLNEFKEKHKQKKAFWALIPDFLQ